MTLLLPPETHSINSINHILLKKVLKIPLQAEKSKKNDPYNVSRLPRFHKYEKKLRITKKYDTSKT